eukprot:CAMPEP_0118950064 /NCGR_PEP_ID=MMETSP1169-20130426/50708_1 /TAXON_ID=36882 /ORGANISM="Pyramimonas obovata, Strain CCMP722" /LENGTH=145 /DNA_ID=CAMNT_0006896827 /DNA_START=124 /DNA_END=557 /DNA_ORIENTATION=-
MSETGASAPPPPAPPMGGADASRVRVVRRRNSAGDLVQFLAVQPSQIPPGCPGLDGTLSTEYNCPNSRQEWNRNSLALPRAVGKVRGSAPGAELTGEDVAVQAQNSTAGQSDGRDHDGDSGDRVGGEDLGEGSSEGDARRRGRRR